MDVESLSEEDIADFFIKYAPHAHVTVFEIPESIVKELKHGTESPF